MTTAQRLTLQSASNQHPGETPHRLPIPEIIPTKDDCKRVIQRSKPSLIHISVVPGSPYKGKGVLKFPRSYCISPTGRMITRPATHFSHRGISPTTPPHHHNQPTNQSTRSGTEYPSVRNRETLPFAVLEIRSGDTVCMSCHVVFATRAIACCITEAQ